MPETSGKCFMIMAFITLCSINLSQGISLRTDGAVLNEMYGSFMAAVKNSAMLFVSKL